MLADGTYASQAAVEAPVVASSAPSAPNLRALLLVSGRVAPPPVRPPHV